MLPGLLSLKIKQNIRSFLGIHAFAVSQNPIFGHFELNIGLHNVAFNIIFDGNHAYSIRVDCRANRAFGLLFQAQYFHILYFIFCILVRLKVHD